MLLLREFFRAPPVPVAAFLCETWATDSRRRRLSCLRRDLISWDSFFFSLLYNRKEHTNKAKNMELSSSLQKDERMNVKTAARINTVTSMTYTSSLRLVQQTRDVQQTLLAYNPEAHDFVPESDCPRAPIVEQTPSRTYGHITE